MIETKCVYKCDKCGYQCDAERLFKELAGALDYDFGDEDVGDSVEEEEAPSEATGSDCSLGIPSIHPRFPSQTKKRYYGQIKCPVSGCDYTGSTPRAVYQHCWKHHKKLKIKVGAIRTFNETDNPQPITTTQEKHRERVKALENVRSKRKKKENYFDTLITNKKKFKA